MGSKLARIVSTFTFRLALVYVGLFSLSVILLFAFIYTFAMNYLQTQIMDAIRLQYDYLLNEYNENGSYGMEERIKELVAKDEEGNQIYLLVNRDYEKLAGNLNEWPAAATKEGSFGKEGNWVRFRIEDMRGSEKGIAVKALMVPLSKWRFVVIGQSLQNKERIEQIIVQTFWASLLLTVCMALIGAIIMTRSITQRINVINRSAATIMGGHLSTRIPYTQGGDEFDELSMNLNSMLDRIESLLESLSQFSSNIAHDLRSPLTRIINRLDAGLRSMNRDSAVHQLLEENIHDLEELVATFNSILKITELEANPEFRPFEPCDLSRILSNLAEFYEPYAAEKHIALSSNIVAPVTIIGEKNLLNQAFANILDNAVKFTPNGGAISIACARVENFAEVIIADNGPGIAELYRHKVFEKFFRMEQSRNTKGNGLGLSLVAAIARIHNADIALEDNQPGLRVRIRMPLRASP